MTVSQIIVVATLIPTLVLLGLTVRVASLPVRHRPGRDVARVVIAIAGIAIMSWVIGVNTPLWAAVAASAVGFVLGLVQGRTAEVAGDSTGLRIRRSPVTLAAWAVGIALMHGAGLVSKAGVFRVGQAVGLFGVASMLGALLGRRGPIQRFRESLVAPAVGGLLLVPVLALLVSQAPAVAQEQQSDEPAFEFVPGTYQGQPENLDATITMVVWVEIDNGSATISVELERQYDVGAAVATLSYDCIHTWADTFSGIDRDLTDGTLDFATSHDTYSDVSRLGADCSEELMVHLSDRNRELQQAKVGQPRPIIVGTPQGDGDVLIQWGSVEIRLDGAAVGSDDPASSDESNGGAEAESSTVETNPDESAEADSGDSGDIATEFDGSEDEATDLGVEPDAEEPAHNPTPLDASEDGAAPVVDEASDEISDEDALVAAVASVIVAAAMGAISLDDAFFAVGRKGIDKVLIKEFVRPKSGRSGTDSTPVATPPRLEPPPMPVAASAESPPMPVAASPESPPMPVAASPEPAPDPTLLGQLVDELGDLPLVRPKGELPAEMPVDRAVAHVELDGQEGLLIDFDGDGAPEVLAVDLDNDGQLEGLADTDRDGKPDQIWVKDEVGVRRRIPLENDQHPSDALRSPTTQVGDGESDARGSVQRSGRAEEPPARTAASTSISEVAEPTDWDDDDDTDPDNAAGTSG